jgi:hypothetical protein
MLFDDEPPREEEAPLVDAARRARLAHPDDDEAAMAAFSAACEADPDLGDLALMRILRILLRRAADRHRGEQN